jgi:hypothetical protein
MRDVTRRGAVASELEHAPDDGCFGLVDREHAPLAVVAVWGRPCTWRPWRFFRLLAGREPLVDEAALEFRDLGHDPAQPEPRLLLPPLGGRLTDPSKGLRSCTVVTETRCSRESRAARRAPPLGAERDRRAVVSCLRI